MAHQQGSHHGEHAKVRSVNDDVKPAAAEAAESHPLAPLEAHLNGSVHNAGEAIKALEDWVAKEIAKLRAEFSKEKGE